MKPTRIGSGGAPDAPVNISEAWFPFNLQVNPESRIRLFCLPYGGGSAQIFNEWPKAFPREVEVCAIQLPGRGRRLKEAPFTELLPLVRSLADAVYPRLDKPFAFFGHSMGALLSFELARELRRRGHGGLTYLFVSGHRAPQVPGRGRNIHRLPEEELLEELRILKGTPTEILENAELMRLLLPSLRADFAVCETYQYEHEAPLDCPITAFCGLQDDHFTQADIEPWRRQTNRAFSLHFLPGDHFFLHSAASALLRVVAARLAR